MTPHAIVTLLLCLILAVLLYIAGVAVPLNAAAVVVLFGLRNDA